MNLWTRHPAVRTGDELTLGERVADSCVRAMGSWKFIIVQAGFMAAWMALNTTALVHHWDVYPFVLLNLALSTQAAFAAPLILLAGRRQDQRNSEVAQADLQSDRRSETILRAIAAHLGVPASEDPVEGPSEDSAVGPTGGPGGVPAGRTHGGIVAGANYSKDSDAIPALLQPAVHYMNVPEGVDAREFARQIVREMDRYRGRSDR